MDLAHDQLRHLRFVEKVVSAENPTGLVNSEVSRSWRRCLNEYGLDPVSDKAPEFVEHSDLTERQDKMSEMLGIARVEMTTLYQQLAGSGYGVLLTDTDGVILHYVGDPDFSETAAQKRLRVGAIWTEKEQGTNGIGTCLVERKPLVIHRHSHFMLRNVELTCSAAPIFDPQGRILGVLDASGTSRLAQEHTVVLVNMSAQMIENRGLFCAFRNHFLIRFHSRPEFVGTLGEGVLALDGNLVVRAANRSSLFQLGSTREGIYNRHMSEIFSVENSDLLDRATNHNLRPLPIYDANSSRRFFALVQAPDESLPSCSRSKLPVTRDLRPNAATASPPPTRSLDLLEFGDYRMARNVECAKRIVDRNIAILILGETGTGKGLFAKALHEASNRAQQPFVAVNCAAIPESLIESELFGYRPGAFTGASREGRRGRILQASEGTLFLDEIGDMPLSLQARLLRVLEEKEVVPLGCDTPIAVDVHVISASHQDLRALVAEGKFREDLYYRLQGVTLSLPPLRERTDRTGLIFHLLRLESEEDGAVSLSEAAVTALEQYSWPGNIRQLRNALRTMLALRVSDRITEEDIPAEILQQERAASSGTTSVDGETNRNPLAEAERAALVRVLDQYRWSVTNAARELGFSRNTMYRKLKRYGIRPSR